MGPGVAVLNSLQNQLYYDNLYFDSTKINKAGVKIGQVNRPLFLESLQNKLMTNSMRVNSARFSNELGTFEYNVTTKKAQAQKGKHDDAIMSMCLALLVRDSMSRDIPIGAQVDISNLSRISNDVYEDIKRELMEGKPEEVLEMSSTKLFEDDVVESESFQFRRKYEGLLREFGW